jgi:hypothetical protein
MLSFLILYLECNTVSKNVKAILSIIMVCDMVDYQLKLRRLGKPLLKQKLTTLLPRFVG